MMILVAAAERDGYGSGGRWREISEAAKNCPLHDGSALMSRAYEIASDIQGTVTADPLEAEGEDMYLRLDPDGLSLVSGKMELRGDFRQMIRRVLGGRLQHEKLLRVIKWKGMPDEPLAVDATAGLGEDSFIMAAAGFRVIMFEYNPIIAALLGDALERAQNSVPSVGEGDYERRVSCEEIREIALRMELRTGDGIRLMNTLEERPDIIYLDPMFPPKQKSGIAAKKLQLFQKLESPCAREGLLLDAAYDAGPKRIVVKRPIKGAPLAGRKPAYAISCRNVRYDCYLPAAAVSG